VIRSVALAGALSLLVLLAPGYAPPLAATAQRLPPLMLWAWERPEDLRGLAADVGVAFLAQTITIDGARADVRPRRQRLRVDAGTVLVAVTRVETRRADRGIPEAPTGPGRRALQDAERVAAAIARTASLPQVAGVQVDFDAAASERAFYRDLLTRLRARLPRDTTLSITALASWCGGDSWMAALPIDEAVPMLFRMGPFNEPYARLAQASPQATGDRSPRRRIECRGALGLSLDEPRAIETTPRRIYVFNPEPWTARTIADARREAGR
jgi:uncharacterized protein DUF3142